MKGMNKAIKSHEIDMTRGKLFPNIMKFAVPLMATGVLQLLFSTADMVVVGSFVGMTELAAVGATASLVTLIVNFFIGLSMGAGIATSNAYGAGDADDGSRILHTSVPVAIISGAIVTIFGVLMCKPLLLMMDTPANCMPHAEEYLTIYFCGAIFNLLYNFGAAVLRATGDTVRPLIFLAVAGVLNIIVNIVSVLVFKMGVAGVAYATIASQAVSCVLVVIALLKNKGFIRLEIKKIRIHGSALKKILRLGIPSGLQNSLFALSNVLIQKTINGFGDVYVAGNTAARELEGFVYTMMNAVANTAVTAVGQNYGANKFDRIKESIIECVITAAVIGLVAGGIILLLHDFLTGLYIESDDAQVKELAKSIAFERLRLFLSTYFLCGVMDVLNCSMRGIGSSVLPMVIVLVGTCIFRIVWIYLIFPLRPTFLCVILSYPISWALTIAAGLIALCIVYKKRKREMELHAAEMLGNEKAGETL